MSGLTTRSKIRKFFEQKVISRVENWQEQLCNGDIHGFEMELCEQLSAVYDQVCKEVLPAAAEQVYEQLEAKATPLDILKKKRKVTIFKVDQNT